MAVRQDFDDSEEALDLNELCIQQLILLGLVEIR